MSNWSWYNTTMQDDSLSKLGLIWSLVNAENMTFETAKVKIH